MSRLTIGLTLVLALVACGPGAAERGAEEAGAADGAGEETARSEQEQGQEAAGPADNEVIISVVCPPPQSAGQASVTVHPLHKLVPADPTPVVWTYRESGQGVVDAHRLTPETPDGFPWAVDEFDGEGWTGEPIAAYYDAGVWKYAISMSCNGDPITWDPRMEIGRGGGG